MRALLLVLIWPALAAAQAGDASTPPPWQSPPESEPEAAQPAAEPIPEAPAEPATPAPTPPAPAPALDPPARAQASPSVLFFPALRVQLGPAFLFGFGPTNANSNDFALDLQAGLRLILRDTPGGVEIVDGTAGYTYTGGALGGNAFTLGGSVLFGNPVVAVGPAAYLLLGQMADHDRFAAGLRAGARFDFFLGLVGLEVSYEGRFANGLAVHELRLMLSSEAVAMLLAAAFIH